MGAGRTKALFAARRYRARWIIIGEPFDAPCDVSPWRYYFAPIEDET